MQSVILLLGSNDIGASAIISRSIEYLRERVGEVVVCSAEYRSQAYGFHSEQEFINRCVELTTTLSAEELLRRINIIEEEMGRNRAEERKIREARGERYASRPIDIDIIFYGDDTFSTERLTIPYHFLSEREYALRPLAEIAPNRRHPSLGYTPRQMLEQLISKGAN